MSTLHTVNKSPFAHTTLASCLEVCSRNDSILLIEDGVLAGICSSPCAEQLAAAIKQDIKVYALLGDVKARGLESKLHPDIHVTDYNGFVQLSIECRCVQSWY